jgi:hypothetical protein
VYLIVFDHSLTSIEHSIFNMYDIKNYPVFSQAVTKTEYRDLVSHAKDATVFNDLPWIEVNDRYSTATAKLFITCRIQQTQELIAFIALGIKTEKLFKLSVRVARFLQYPYGDRIGILIHPDHLQSWNYLLSELSSIQSNKWDLIIWDEWSETQGLIETTNNSLPPNTGSVFIKQTSRCPIVRTINTTKEDIIGRLSTKKISDIRRCKKKIEKLPHKIVHFFPETEQVQPILREISSLEQASWKGDGDQGIFSNPKCSDFFNDISTSLADHKQLFLSLLYINDQLATYRYGFVFRNTFLDYSIAYRPDFRSLSPGSVLLNELLSEAIDRRFDWVDGSRVGANSNNSLIQFECDNIPHYRLYWFTKTFKGWILRQIYANTKPFLKRARNFWRRHRNRQR